MKTTIKTRVYIDSANLYFGAKAAGYLIDFEKFYRWLNDKYKPERITLFVGRIESMRGWYRKLESFGFGFIFKETREIKGSYKGNCDAELVLECVHDICHKNIDRAILVTGDGDFECLVRYMYKQNIDCIVLVPYMKHSSVLLRRVAKNLFTLEEHYRKVAKRIRPEKDRTSTGRNP